MWPIIVNVQKVNATDVRVQVCDYEAINNSETNNSNWLSDKTHVVNEYMFKSGKAAAIAVKGIQTLISEYEEVSSNEVYYYSIVINGAVAQSGSERTESVQKGVFELIQNC